jgi:DNA polymerase-3 subunit gamma/tau
LLAWRTIVQKVRETEGQLAAFLNHAMLVELTKEKILLGLESGTVFDTSLIRSPAAVSLLKAAAAAHFGKEPEIAFEAINLGQATHTVAALDTLEKFERKQAALTRAKDHPRIAEVTQILGARLKEIRLPEE